MPSLGAARVDVQHSGVSFVLTEGSRGRPAFGLRRIPCAPRDPAHRFPETQPGQGAPGARKSRNNGPGDPRDVSGKENVENANPPLSGRTPARKVAPALKATTAVASDEPFAAPAEAEQKAEVEIRDGSCWEHEYDALLKVKVTKSKYDFKVQIEQQRELIIHLKCALEHWHDETHASHALCAAKDNLIAVEVEARAQLQRQIDSLRSELAVRTDSHAMQRALIADAVTRGAGIRHAGNPEVR